MQLTKQLKQLLSNAYEVEGELTDLIEQCFKEIFQEQASLAYSMFEEDVQSGREYNGCLQGLHYYKQQIADNDRRMKEYKEKDNEKNEM